MKKLLRPRREALHSLAGFLDPRQIHSAKTGRASGKSCRKSLIINDQFLRSPPKASGNVRLCTFTAPRYPEPIRGNPKLRAETCASGPGVENPNGNTGLNGPVQHPQSLHRVALCCSVLHRVARKNSQTSGATPPLSRQSRAGAWWFCRDAPSSVVLVIGCLEIGHCSAISE